MNDIGIGLGLILNMIFWIAVISAVAILAVRACVYLLDVRPKVRKNIRAGRRRNASPHPSPASEETEDRYRKAA